MRQRLRGFWDQRNLDRRQVQAGYRASRVTGATPTVDPKQATEIQGFLEARARYVEVRACERARNRYELRSRYQTHERGGRRKAWSRKGKYELPTLRTQLETRVQTQRDLRKGREGGSGGTPSEPTPGSVPGTHPGLNERRRGLRGERRDKEAEALEARYATRRTQAEAESARRLEGRTERCARIPSRGKVEHVRTLRGRATATQEKRRQVKNREGGVPLPYAHPEAEGDPGREILFAVPTTEYFAKRKNLGRRREREARGEAKAEKWRKVPEKARRERRPTWTELEGWMNRRSQGVEDRNRERLLEGKPVSLSTATYAELGKTVVYLYGCERSERWKDKTGANSTEDRPVSPEGGRGKPSDGSRDPTG